ncbi:hypothetical protein C6501_17410 [Candidatus Poribacteria bacterium]|nr:MAG: hypothetical protein C6501_17410 [Candidatus Poribacteria bacterium]
MQDLHKRKIPPIIKKKYRAYFQVLIDELREIHYFTNAKKALPQNCYVFGSGFGMIKYGAMFETDGKALAYVNIYDDVKGGRLNVFDALEKRKSEIHKKFGAALEWIRHEKKGPSRIAFSRVGSIEFSDGELEEIRSWHIKNLLKLRQVLKPEIECVLKTPANSMQSISIGQDNHGHIYAHNIETNVEFGPVIRKLNKVFCHQHSYFQQRYPRFILCPYCRQDAPHEAKVVEAVINYFSPKLSGFFIKTEYEIQMGVDKRRADVVIVDRKQNLSAIIECKREGFSDVKDGRGQLYSYLTATATPLGVFANSIKSNNWIFYGNLGRNKFIEITLDRFWEYIQNTSLNYIPNP